MTEVPWHQARPGLLEVLKTIEAGLARMSDADIAGQLDKGAKEVEHDPEGAVAALLWRAAASRLRAHSVAPTEDPESP